MENGKDQRTIKAFLEAGFVPIGILVIDDHEGRSFRRRRVCKSILSIAAVYTMAEVSRKSKEHALDGLFNTGGVGRCNSMKSRCHTWASIAAIVGTTGAVALDEVAPMWTKDNCTFRVDNRGTVHAKLVEVVKLLPFALLP